MKTYPIPDKADLKDKGDTRIADCDLEKISGGKTGSSGTGTGAKAGSGSGSGSGTTNQPTGTPDNIKGVP